MDDGMIQVCTHCGNKVEKIEYLDKQPLVYGQIQNEYKHSRPRSYPVCSKNPITEEDVEWKEEFAT